MKQTKRFLALFLAIVLTVNLLPGNVFATTIANSSASNEPGDNIILVEDFEIGDTFKSNTNSGVNSVYPDVVWNGAEPVEPSYFGYYLGTNEPTFLLTAGVGDAYNGSSCVAVEYNTNVKMKPYVQYLMYNNEDAIGKMEDGATYVASVWVKQNAGKANGALVALKVKSTKDGDLVAEQAARSTEWTKLEVEFVYDESKKSEFVINIEPKNARQTTDIAYFDYLVVEKVADAPVADATVSLPETAAVEVGATTEISAIVTPAGTAITWSSSDETVATVDQNGVVTGVAAGEAIITAAVDGASDTCTVTVTEPESKIILVEDFEIGDTFKSNTNSGVNSVYPDVVWNGAEPVEPSYFGYYLGTNEPTFLLTAGVGDAYNGSSCVAVEYNTNVKMKPYVQYLMYNNEDAIGKMEDGATYIASVWVKQNAGKANGALVALKVKSTKDGDLVAEQAARSTEWTKLEVEFVYDESRKSEFVINIEPKNARQTTDIAYFDYLVVEKKDETAVEVTVSLPETATVKTGKTTALSATVRPAGTAITWSSSDETVATVDQNGVVTGVAVGEAIITAAVDGASDTCKVTVKAPFPKYGVVFSESFESFADENTVITDIYSNRGADQSTTDALVTWNGATVAEGWGVFIGQGHSALLQPAVGTAHDGNVSIKLTPASGKRMQITYTMPEADYEEIVDGGRYRVTVYYKSEGANFNANMEVKAMSGAASAKFVMTNGEWIKGSYDVTVDKSYGRFSLYFGVASPAGTKGSMYIDNITVERIPWVTDITLDKTASYLEVGETLELNYTMGPVGEESEVIFNSSDPSIAEVDANGKITAKKPGTAEIVAFAASGIGAAKCIVNVVEEYVELESISLNKTTLNVNPGWQEKLTVSFNPSNAIENKVVWTSSDESVVKVDENGNLLVLKVGTATITATAPASGRTATCNVTVVDNSDFASTSKNVTVDFGMNETVDLSQILSGNYTVINKPAKGKAELSGNSLKYTSYTWLMEEVDAFVDRVYTDTVKVAVQSGDKSAIITLNVTINKLADLFYDENGEWITDVDLMFSREYLDAVKAEIKAEPNGERAKVFALMLSVVDEYLDARPLSYDYSDMDSGAAKYDQQLRPVAQQTANFLMAYLLTKDMPGYEAKNAQYLEKTIEWTKAALEYPYWGARPASRRNCDLPAGQFLFSVSMVYYWLKDEIKDETCTQIMGTDGTMDTVVTKNNVPMLDAIEERLWFVCSEMYEHNIGGTNLVGNHMHVRMAGLIAATFALRPDADTAEKQQLLINYTGMVMYNDGTAMHCLMPDGTSQEGLQYWAYSAEMLIKAGVMIRNGFGIDLFETTNYLKHSGDYLLFNMMPQDSWTSSENILDTGDSKGVCGHGPGLILRFIAAEYGDTNALWLAHKVEEAGIEGGLAQWMNVMLTDTTLQPEAPGLDKTLQWFKDMDHVIARTDWSGNEDLLSIKCGVPCGMNLLLMKQTGEFIGLADAGHAHPDANHITLFSNGEYLLRDDGPADKTAGNHNTLLVNGQGQLGEGMDWMAEEPYIDDDMIPFIKLANSTAAYDYIVGNATEAYDATLGLELFERNILWLKEEQVLLVVDNIKSLTPVDLELRWFPYSKSVGISGNAYIISSNKNVMNFYPLTDDTTTVFEDVNILFQESVGTEKTFRQTYTGRSWQNAVAFSWDEAGGEAAYVTYTEGENVGEHQFGVNGKIYTINVATNEITVTEGELEVEGDTSVSDSTLSTVMMNGVVFDEFDPSITEYEIDRWWKTSKLNLNAYTNGYGATVEYDYDNKAPGTITITCTSKDGTSKTVYTINVTNSEKVLGIESATTDSPREGYNIDWTYDSVITPTSKGDIWANIGLPTIIYDLGKVVNLEDVIIAFNLSARRESYFDLSYSIDGENWTYLMEDATAPMTSGELNGYHDPVKVKDDANVNARYIKVKLRAHNQNSKDDPGAYCSIQEITFTGSEYPVVNVTGGTIADAKDFYEVGDEITVTAEVPEGKKFVRWEVEGIDVDDLTNPTITFTLGTDDVKLVAIFEDATIDGGGDDDDDGKDDTTNDDKDDGAADTSDNSMLMPALLLAVMALAACAVLTVGKKYRR